MREDDSYSYRVDDAYINYVNNGRYANSNNIIYRYGYDDTVVNDTTIDDAAANDDENWRRLEVIPFHLYTSDSDLKVILYQ